LEDYDGKHQSHAGGIQGAADVNESQAKGRQVNSLTRRVAKTEQPDHGVGKKMRRDRVPWGNYAERCCSPISDDKNRYQQDRFERTDHPSRDFKKQDDGSENEHQIREEKGVLRRPPVKQRA
jgi:hypothetical protein